MFCELGYSKIDSKKKIDNTYFNEPKQLKNLCNWQSYLLVNKIIGRSTRMTKVSFLLMNSMMNAY